MNKFDQIEEALVEIHRRECERIESVRKKNGIAIVDTSIKIIAREAIIDLSELRNEYDLMTMALNSLGFDTEFNRK